MNEINDSIEGWIQRGVYDEPVLSELIEMYGSLGFDVRVEPFRPDLVSGCSECMKDSDNQYKILYTFKKQCRPDVNSDIF